MTNYVDDIIAEGFSVTQFISQLHDAVVSDNQITDNQKSAICEKLAVSEARLIDGASEYLQLLDIVTLIMNQLSQK